MYDIDNKEKIKIEINVEPNSKLMYNVNKPICSDSIKEYIKNGVLWIGPNFESTINLNDNNDIKNIYFYEKNEFDSDLNSLPSSLIHLEFYPETYFSQPINNLPQGLKTLILGYSFENSVDNLPDSLKKLHFIGRFNNPIDNLPANLEILILCEFFNQNISSLPKGLKKLVLSNNFAKSLDNLPENLIYLKFDNNYDWIGNLNNLPNSIQFLFLDLNSYNFSKEPILKSLPKSIKYLEIITKQKLLFEDNYQEKNFLLTKSRAINENRSFLNKYELFFL